MSPTGIDLVAARFGHSENRELADLFSSMELAVALCEIVVDDDGLPVDYRYIAVNAAFVTVTGFPGATGRLASEVAPNFHIDWVHMVAPAAIGRTRVRTEVRVRSRWFDLSAVPVGVDGHFALVFREETARHAALQDLRGRAEELRDGLNREREQSRRLQRALLPDALVQGDRITVSAHYRAAHGDTQVGGDWYDSYRWDDGRVGAIVGDVVGHGVEAAASMGRVRVAAATLAPLAEGRPMALLQSLGDAACGPNGCEYMTAISVVVDCEHERLAYARCGHPPALLRLPDGSTQWLDESNAPPLGRIVGAPDPTRSGETTVPMPPHSTVILFSDGLIERRGEDLRESLDRFRQIVERMPPFDPVWAAAQIAEHMVDVTPGDDDVAILTLHLHPAPDD